MSNERHIQVGNHDFFLQYLDVNEVVKKNNSDIPQYYGLKIIENKLGGVL